MRCVALNSIALELIFKRSLVNFELLIKGYFNKPLNNA